MDEGILTTEEYAQRHQKAFRTAFNFLNSHFPPGDGDEWWLQITKDASDESVLHGENKLIIGLLVAVVDYIEDEWKKRRAENGTASD